VVIWGYVLKGTKFYIHWHHTLVVKMSFNSFTVFLSEIATMSSKTWHSRGLQLNSVIFLNIDICLKITVRTYHVNLVAIFVEDLHLDISLQWLAHSYLVGPDHSTVDAIYITWHCPEQQQNCKILILSINNERKYHIFINFKIAFLSLEDNKLDHNYCFNPFTFAFKPEHFIIYHSRAWCQTIVTTLFYIPS